MKRADTLSPLITKRISFDTFGSIRYLTEHNLKHSFQTTQTGTVSRTHAASSRWRATLIHCRILLNEGRRKHENDVPCKTLSELNMQNSHLKAQAHKDFGVAVLRETKTASKNFQVIMASKTRKEMANSAHLQNYAFRAST